MPEMDEEIKQLEKLLIEDKYEKALRAAEELYESDRPKSSRDVLALQCALSWAKVCLGKPNEALAVAQVATQLAVELEEWDYYGIATHFLGTAYSMLKQYPSAIKVYHDFLELSDRYSWASRFTALEWYNLGVTYAFDGQLDKVIEPLQTGLRIAETTGNERFAYGIYQGLAEHYLRSNELREVPRLLAKCARYLRHHPEAGDYQSSRMYHLQLRVKYAAQTGRYHKARSLAMRGVLESQADYNQRRTFHMLLAMTSLDGGHASEALKHAVAAQVYSGYVDRKDWEEEAEDLIRRSADALGVPVPDVDQYFLDVAGFEEV